MTDFPATPRTSALIVQAQRIAERTGIPLVLTAGENAFMAVTGPGGIHGLDSEQRRADLRAALEKAAKEKSVQTMTGRRRIRANTTIKRHDKHVGRNDPCPCGSGKKFKACCRKIGW